MSFITIDSNSIQNKLSLLQEDTQPLWGNMSAQAMVEHLENTIDLSLGKLDNIKLEIPEDKIERAQAFLESDHPMPKNFKVGFAPDRPKLKYDNIDIAKENLLANWKSYQEYFSNNPDATFLHPSFGELNRSQFDRLHMKHFNHHFNQFGLL